MKITRSDRDDDTWLWFDVEDGDDRREVRVRASLVDERRIDLSAALERRAAKCAEHWRRTARLNQRADEVVSKRDKPPKPPK